MKIHETSDCRRIVKTEERGSWRELGFFLLLALKIDDLVALGQDLMTLVQHHGLDEANSSRPMNNSSCGFQTIPRGPRR